MDFSKFKERSANSQKSTFSAKIENDIYTEFMKTKAEHKEAECDPYKIHDIVEALLIDLTEQMKKDIANKKANN
tara:strand:- start:9385 stop:9606 length:222 start_codon:yes stop_codon:yes gene_type:complete